MKLAIKCILGVGCLLILGCGAYWILTMSAIHPSHELGQEIDSFNGIPVYYNGGVGNVSGRHLAADGYNYGLRYQCVEFVKRYYYDHLNHKMPNTYGHAKDFYDRNIPDGKVNPDRNLIQHSNPGSGKPAVNDLLIFDRTSFNPFGHVAIISKVSDTEIEIIQQNPGVFAASRKTYSLSFESGKWRIKSPGVLGWLKKGQSQK